MIPRGGVSLHTLVVLCVAGIWIAPSPLVLISAVRGEQRQGYGAGSIRGGRLPRGLAKTVARGRGYSENHGPVGPVTSVDDSHSSADCSEGTRRREIGLLRQLLQGRSETLEKALERQAEQHADEEEKERVCAEREQRRRERAGEVAFLRSVAIRDAQGNISDTILFAASAAVGAAPQRCEVSTANSGPGFQNPELSKDCEQSCSEPAGNKTHTEKPAGGAGGIACARGKKKARWTGLMPEERGEENGEDYRKESTLHTKESALHFSEHGASLSEQANLHAQQEVQRALQDIEQGHIPDSMGDWSDNSGSEAALRGTATSLWGSVLGGGSRSGGGDPSSLRMRVGVPRRGERNEKDSGEDGQKRERKAARRERRRQMLHKAMEEEKQALRKGMADAEMLAARAEGEERWERMQKADEAHAAFVQALTGAGAATTIAGVAEQVTCKAFAGKEMAGQGESGGVVDGRRWEWEGQDKEALEVARMRHARPFLKLEAPAVPEDEIAALDSATAATTATATTPDSSVTAAKARKDGRGVANSIEVMVDFIADPACPWCYVARRQLENALEIVRKSKYDVEVSVNWRPWLYSNPPSEGQLLGQYLKQGSYEAATLMHLPGLAQGDCFRGWRWWPNSLQAQRLLVLLAEVGGRDVSLLGLDLLQRLTFEEGANISQRRILCAVATELGIEDPVKFFRSKLHRQKVLTLIQESNRLLESIPAPVFRISSTLFPTLGTLSVTGAQGSDGILIAISDIVLAVRRRQGLEKPLKSWTPRLEVDNPKYRGLGPMPNQYEMHA